MYKVNFPKKRYERTFDFLSGVISKNEKILDLGVKNPFAERLKKAGFKVTNTQGEDLDTDSTAVQVETYDVLTAFEILEHLLNPFTVLKQSRAKKLVASVPLRLWFASAYCNTGDPLDRHY
ncbi:MAG: methyltransferase, partial [Marinirhabdus sp.]